MVSVLLFENVDSRDDAGDQASDSNLESACRQLAEVGFSLLTILTDSKLFYLPQSRRRYYIVGLKDIAPPHFDFTKTGVKHVLALVQKYVGACQREPPCASIVLLREDSLPVENELNRRLSAGEKHTQYNVSAKASLAFRDAASVGEMFVSRMHSLPLLGMELWRACRKMC